MHYNLGRPHSALRLGLPEPVSEQVPSNAPTPACRVPGLKRSALGGLHHEYERGCLKTSLFLRTTGIAVLLFLLLYFSAAISAQHTMALQTELHRPNAL
jgi:hypothetical protein